MRLWSINFSYLDQVGIVALWRESLLAKAVLEGKTKGYKMHPQLERFKKSENQIESINTYLSYVLEESVLRGYKFNNGKINFGEINPGIKIEVTEGQLDYEFLHLKNKLKVRSPEDLKRINHIKFAKPCKLFVSVKGPVEAWERMR